MYHIYTTKAFVLKSVPVGETNRLYFLLTRDLGLIRTTAQGVRLSASKLKGHLSTLALTNVSLVKGKEIWRLTSAQAEQQPNLRAHPEKLAVLKRLASLILRLVHGEDTNEALFDAFAAAHAYLSLESTDESKDVETLTVLRMLFVLGYFKETDEIAPLVASADMTVESLAIVQNARKRLVRDINKALAETHL